MKYDTADCFHDPVLVIDRPSPWPKFRSGQLELKCSQQKGIFLWHHLSTDDILQMLVHYRQRCSNNFSVWIRGIPYAILNWWLLPVLYYECVGAEIKMFFFTLLHFCFWLDEFLPLINWKEKNEIFECLKFERSCPTYKVKLVREGRNQANSENYTVYNDKPWSFIQAWNV